MFNQAQKPQRASMAQALLIRLSQVLCMCLVTVLLFSLTRHLGRQSSSDPNQLRVRTGPNAFALTNHSMHQRHKAAAHVQFVVPDVGSFTADVLQEVAKAVVQLEQQGKGRRVIAVSLYGNDTKYTQGAVENALLAKRDWPGWTYRVYHGDGVPSDVLEAIQALGGELMDMTARNATQGRVSSTFWRFLALTDRTATRVIFRDTDSRLTPRDRAAVDEWMKSEYLFHIMHDHPSHHTWPVLAGMFGAVNGLLHPRMVLQWFQQDAAQTAGEPKYKWYADQEWLKQEIWPLVRGFALSHSSFHCGKFGEAESKGFPIKRTSPRDFLGNVHTKASNWQGRIMRGDGRKCPKECRRQPDWDTC